MPNPLPKIEALPGSVHVQRVRCGRSNCRCARGETHEAFYRFWWEDGRLRKAYVRRADLESVRAGCDRWRECERAKRALLSTPDADDVRAQQRATLRAAGVPSAANAYSLRSRSKDSPSRDLADEIGAGRLSLPWLSLPSFRFG